MVQKLLKLKHWIFLNKLYLILILFGTLSYINTFHNQFFFDDEAFILRNLNVTSFDIPKMFTTNTVAGSGVSSDYYRPLTSLTFALDYKIWKNNPFGFHLVNLVLHLATGLLLFKLLKKLKMSSLISFFISLIFLVHPAGVEAVTYISSRGDIVYSLLTCLSFYFFASSFYFKKSQSVVALVLSVLIYGISIFGKEVALGVFPLYFAITAIFYLSEKISFKKFHQKYKAQIISVLLIVWLALMYMILRLYFLNFNNSLNFVNAQNIYTQNLLVRIYTFFKIFWIYLKIIIFPYPLFFERTTSFVTTFFSLPVISTLFFILVIIFLSLWEILKKRTIYIFFGALWMAVHLIPVSGVIPMTYLLHENWLYMPIVGFLILTIFTFKLFIPKINPQFQKIFLILGFLAAILLMFLTLKQNTIWKDPETFYKYNIKFNPSNRMRLNLASIYMNSGRSDQAKALLDQLVKEGDAPTQAYYNLGIIFDSRQDYSQAENYYLQTITSDPTFLYAYQRLVDAYIKDGKKAKALPYEKILSEIYPDEKAFHLIYGRLLWETGDKVNAEVEFKKALELTGNNQAIQQQIADIKDGKVNW